MIIFLDNPPSQQLLERVQKLPTEGSPKTANYRGTNYQVITYVELCKGSNRLKLFLRILGLALITLGFAFCKQGFRSDCKAVFHGRKIYEVYSPSPLEHIEALERELKGKSAASSASSLTAVRSPEIESLCKQLIESPVDLLLTEPPVNQSEDLSLGLSRTQRRMKDYPDIYECHCKSILSRDGYIGDWREKMETKLIEKIANKFPLARFPEISICSIASGGCFQELVLHAKLSKLGYRVSWILVDPIHTQQVPKAFNAFTHLTQQISPGIQTRAVYDFEGFFAEAEQPALKADIFLMIDTDLHSSLTLINRERWEPLLPVGSLSPSVDGETHIQTERKIAELINQLKNARLRCQSYTETVRGCRLFRGAIKDYQATDPATPSIPATIEKF